ncbi:MAG: sugar phosphate isomerase/epimerase [Bryobacterales bacterium]|nr:sugar phosphate isomerase/epimerase [Bryobacterales bacterium]
MTRRSLLSTFAAVPALSPLTASAAGARLPIRKGVLLGMLPRTLSYEERFKLAKDCGFESMECGTAEDEREAEQIKKASDSAGLPIHSVMNQAHWKFPLSSADPQVVAQSVKGMETSLRNAKLWGAKTVLLVPAVVNPETSYQDAWTRSQREIRKLIPMASDLKVIIAVEEVWNKFLLSPLEFARYVDDFNSPWVKAYFDVGNVALYGYPQDWIRTLGKRIVKVHLKDFAFRGGVTHWTNLRDGELNWKEIYKAFAEIKYEGDATVELSGGDAFYLRDVSHRVDLILEGA